MVEKFQYDPENTQSIYSGNGMGQHYTNPLSMIVRRAVALAKNTEAQKILELACGLGVTSLALAQETQAQDIVAIDIHAGVVAELSRAASQLTPDPGVIGPIRALVYDAAHSNGYSAISADECDLVIAKDLYPFLDPGQIDRMLTNTQAALRPGGWFMLTAPSTRSHAYKESTEGPYDNNGLYRTLSLDSRHHIQTTLKHFSFTSVLNLAQQLDSYGMEMTEAQHIGTSGGWIMAVAQKWTDRS